MRATALLLAAMLASCTSTVLTEPIVHVSPYLALYQLRGETEMQSAGAQPNQVVDNAPVPLRTFGQDRGREDVGMRVDLGDGFGGLRADYYRLDMNTSRSEQLPPGQNWGDLLAGDFVSMNVEMDELRLGYVEPLLDASVQWRGEDLRLQLGLGGVFATRQMKMRGRESTNTVSQNLELSGDVVYGAVRARAAWQNLSLDLDYAVAPEDLVLGGDIEGLSQDFEAMVSYELPQRDVRVFAGWRYSEFSAAGSQGPYRFENDLVIDGLQLGVLVTF